MNKTIIEYEEKIRKLSQDRAFGILTRNALEMRIDTVSHNFDCVFIDFNGVKQLNDEMGYKNVNSIIRAIFANCQFRSEDLIGRWFSGDEIVVTTEFDIEGLLERLIMQANKRNISFKFKIFKNHSRARGCFFRIIPW